MLNQIVQNKPLLFVIHIFLGILCLNPTLSKLYGFAIIALGGFFIIINNNKNEEALIFSAYLVSAEVLLRMTEGYILYETGKYGVAILLLIGLTQGKRPFVPNVSFIFYLLLILVGIAFTYVPEGESLRRAIVFNLSGPILLAICGFYCYRRSLSFLEISNIMRAMVFPIISMSTFLFFRTPSITEIVFTGSANFSASGGFGPNQVSTSIGLGIACLAALLIVKKGLSGYLFLDGIILIYFIYRGLLTFSRGGLFAAAIALGAFAIFYAIHDAIRIRKLVPYMVVSLFILAGVWLYTSDITGGMLDNRYTGKSASGVQQKDLSSGRVAIFEEQLNSFYENPIFGIGVGNGRFKREMTTRAVTAASHNEIGRLIEEHGLIGLSSLILLFLLPIHAFTTVNTINKAYLVFFGLLWFLTINHSAMRIAIPSLMYGFALLKIYDNDYENIVSRE